MTLTRMTDDRGQVTGHVSTAEDVTERVRAQEAAMEALAKERQAVERLRRVDQAKDAFAIPGSGLGLSIARAVIEKHGGSIEVDSEIEQGTTFRVRVPIVV